MEDEIKISKRVEKYEKALSLMDENNMEEAVQVLLKAIEPMDEQEIYNWGVIYFNGVGGVKKDYEKALKMFELAAGENYASAERALGWMYFQGKGVEKDETKGAKLLLRAYEQGVEDAGLLYVVGQMFLYALYVEEDIVKGIQLLKDAADKKYDENCSAAQCLLGQIYYEGKYIMRDLKEAEKWLIMAKNNGNEEARYLLEKLWNEEKL